MAFFVQWSHLPAHLLVPKIRYPSLDPPQTMPWATNGARLWGAKGSIPLPGGLDTQKSQAGQENGPESNQKYRLGPKTCYSLSFALSFCSTACWLSGKLALAKQTCLVLSIKWAFPSLPFLVVETVGRAISNAGEFACGAQHELNS